MGEAQKSIGLKNRFKNTVEQDDTDTDPDSRVNCDTASCTGMTGRHLVFSRNY